MVAHHLTKSCQIQIRILKSAQNWSAAPERRLADWEMKLMKELESSKIEELTIKAENGNGCAIFDAINEMGFEERHAALKAIDDLNDKRFSRNTTGSELTFEAWDTRYRGFNLRLSIENGAWTRNHELYNDVTSADGTHKGSCEDHNRNKK